MVGIILAKPICVKGASASSPPPTTIGLASAHSTLNGWLSKVYKSWPMINHPLICRLDRDSLGIRHMPKIWRHHATDRSKGQWFSHAIANTRWLTFPLSLVYVALQGVLGHTELCVGMGILKSASHHAVRKDCHLKDRRQPDCKEVGDKILSCHVSLDFTSTHPPQRLPFINFRSKIRTKQHPTDLSDTCFKLYL